MSEKRKRGRPRLSDDDRLGVQVAVRLKKEDYDALKKIARSEGTYVSSFIRKIMRYIVKEEYLNDQT